jgi:phenylacetate-CoA ligase
MNVRTMTTRERYLSIVRKHQLDPLSPGSPAMWSPRLETAPRQRIEEIQSEKIAAAFDYLFEESPYYRARYGAAGLAPGAVRSIADLPKIPVTRKLDWIPDIIAHRPWGTFSPLSEDRWRTAGWMIFSTSGTTLLPRVFRHTTHDQEMWGWMCARALWSYGVRTGQLAVNCFYYGPSVAAWGLHEGLRRIGCTVVAAGSMSAERRALHIKLLRPQVLLGTPSTLLTLGRYMTDLGEDPACVGVKILVCAGEPGAAVWSTRKRLETLWGANVHDDFGCTEVAMAPLGYTCAAASACTEPPVGVHLMEDAVIVEVLDPESLEPVAPGSRGTLVVSNLYSESAPFLRFDMGDWISITQAPCPCGRTHARALGGLLGRNDNCLKVKGLQFFPSTFENALRSIDGTGDEYRLEILAGDRVVIVAEQRPEMTLLPEEVGAKLRRLLGISVEVQLLHAGALPRTEGKGARFFDRRSPPQ